MNHRVTVISANTYDITARSQLSGRENTIRIQASAQQMMKWMIGAETVQDCFPHLSRAEREFLVSGITDDEWKQTFGG